MKKLVNNVINYFKECFTDDDPTLLYVAIPKRFKNKKEQNLMIRQTKNFILENTMINEKAS
jgi:hypothetical protein